MRLAEKAGIDASTLRGSGPDGRVIERDILAASAGAPPLSPLAAERMRSGGFSFPSSGSGPGGRVLSTDLTEVVRDYEEIPVRGIRKVIAERMRQSMTQTTQCTLHSSAPAEALLALRKDFKSRQQFEKITINDILLFTVSRILPDFPEINAHFLGSVMRRFKSVHLGFAVDTDKGLLVPVIRNADSIGLKDLSSEAKRLGKACQEGKALPDELSGSTFSITNLGSLGIEMFTPVLNYPETAILGICSIVDRPVRNADGSIGLAPFLGLSLTFNHEAVDGAPAARFLKAVAERIAEVTSEKFE
jgi:pyruvate dehydrogenase E2 component (dihydrolipoamide acetyltransferase)